MFKHENSSELGNETNQSPIIFPLASDPKLDAEKISSLKVYFDYLNAAFNEPRIHNLAITGGFGVGKSSVIRSFENYFHRRVRKSHVIRSVKNDFYSNHPKIYHFFKEIENLWLKKHNKEFLYISLGQYMRSDSNDQKGKQDLDEVQGAGRFSGKDDGQNCDSTSNLINKAGAREPNKDSTSEGEAKKEDIKDTNAIERRLLLQIYSRFRRKDLPSSSYKLVREKISCLFIKSILGAFFACAILLLMFYKPLCELFTQYRPHLAERAPFLHILLYCIVISGTTLLAGFFFYQLIPRLRLSSLSLKADRAELAFEKEACESYLDQYSMELVYCLEQIADKIDRTVVFEDMDRLSPEKCIQIFTRLREINYLVNLRLDATQYIRFVYVINDDIISSLKYSKFFDCVLPIIPSLNRRSSEIVLREKLGAINVSLVQKQDAKNSENWFNRVEQVGASGIVHKVAPYLADFRLQSMILNEYELLFELFCTNNPSGVREEDAEHLLAFAIYKSIWPEDYSKICDDKSQVLPTCTIDDAAFENWNNKELLKILTDTEHPLLTARCLYYIGYSETEIAKRRKEILESSNPIAKKIEVIDDIYPEDHASIEMVCGFCSSLKYEQASSKGEGNAKIFIAAIQCMIRCKYRNTDWFFKDRNIMDCLEILVQPDEEMIKEFFALVNKLDIYENCKGRSHLENTRDWSESELRVFCLGVQFFEGNTVIMLRNNNGRSLPIKLSDTVKDFRKN